jgi:D-3-phosphoglycerate dehydrogenase / 2-oxoglutarate reductase
MRIVATHAVPAVARRLFASFGEIEIAAPGNGAPLSEAEILIVRASSIDARTVDSNPRLRVIARTGAGLDNIDVAAATRRGVPVLFAPAAGARPVAEGALALIVAAAKRLGELGAIVRSGAWDQRYEVEALDLDGATLGIVGFGRVGREVGTLAGCLGMHVVAYEPTAIPEAVQRGPVELVELDELAAGADVITLHCDLNDTTRGMVDRRLLARMKPGAVLVNAARGSVVESEDVLLEALNDGQLSAIGLDVFAQEPPDPTHPLFRDPRVICTPHAIGLSRGWNSSVFESLANDVTTLLQGGTPENVANPEVLSPDS